MYFGGLIPTIKEGIDWPKNNLYFELHRLTVFSVFPLLSLCTLKQPVFREISQLLTASVREPVICSCSLSRSDDQPKSKSRTKPDWLVFGAGTWRMLARLS